MSDDNVIIDDNIIVREHYYIYDNIFINDQELFKLEHLCLKNRTIRSIPDDFFTVLTNLKWLDLRNNLLTKIPKSIEHHSTLETLLLSNNKITHLPVELCTMKRLKRIQLSGNPLVFPKFSIVDSGIEVLKKYLEYFYKRDNVTEERFGDLLESNDNNGDAMKQSVVKFNEELICKDVNQIDNRGNSAKTKKEIFECQMDKHGNRKKYLNSDKYVKRPKALNKREMTKRIKEKAREETIIEKKRNDLCKIDAILQGRKTKAELKNWRDKYKKQKNSNQNIDFAIDISKFPFGTYEQCSKIITREELCQIQEELNKKKIKTKRRSPETTKDDEYIDVKMTNILKHLNDINIDDNGDSPRQNRKRLSAQMKELIALQKKISLLKVENDNLP